MLKRASDRLYPCRTPWLIYFCQEFSFLCQFDGLHLNGRGKRWLGLLYTGVSGLDVGGTAESKTWQNLKDGNHRIPIPGKRDDQRSRNKRLYMRKMDQWLVSWWVGKLKWGQCLNLYKTFIVTDYINSLKRHTCNTHKFPQIRTPQKPQQLCIMFYLKILCIYISLCFIEFHILTTYSYKQDLISYGIVISLSLSIYIYIHTHTHTFSEWAWRWL